MLGILYTFISLIWHVNKEQLVLRSELPAWMIPFGNGVRRIFFCCQRTRIEGPKVVKIEPDSNNIKQEESTKFKEVSDCYNCETCARCLKSKDKDELKNVKKMEKKVTQSLDFSLSPVLIKNLTQNLKLI